MRLTCFLASDVWVTPVGDIPVGDMALTREVKSSEHVTSAVGETVSDIGEIASDRVDNSVIEVVSVCGPFLERGLTSGIITSGIIAL